MIEVIDNLVQIAVTAAAALGSAVAFGRSRRQEWFLLTCFYGTFALGGLYWVLYLLLMSRTPQIFYVSDLCWAATFAFLMTLEISLPETEEERRFRHPAMWLAPCFCVPMLIFFMRWGDYAMNACWCVLSGISGWFSIRGMLYARRQQGQERERQYFHMVVLVFLILEYALWTASGFWCGDTLANPYFWIDFLITGSLAVLWFAMRRGETAE
ncbi:MAG: histidine kinase [Lachnospiraceae bacterium]|nr:histidine kinase [Lachnospiraceae bacterium]